MPQPKDAVSGDKGAMRIDSKLVRELAALLSENDLTEIEVADGDRRIKVSREPAPVVGAAYLSAEPGGPAFIEVGKPVKAGDTLLIVEAMKVMNPITAPEGGTVKKVLISDGQPVEFDQPLVIIG